MLNLLYALIPVLAWGTWLAPSQNVQYPNQQVKTFYVTAANVGLAILVLLIQGFGSLRGLTASSFWLVFAGGVIWALSGLCAFTATAKIGLARAFGIWAPLNIVVSMLWGAWLFDEFPDTSATGRVTLGVALVIVIVGVLMIIFAKGSALPNQQARNDAWLGYAGAVGAGILWGSYFIPIQIADISMWVGGFPLALGMLAGSALLVGAARQSPRLKRPTDVTRTLLTGVIWGVGNYGMLLLVGALGAGRGFTIAQLSVVVNAIVGILWLKDPEPRSRAAWLTLAGCVLATVGGILLGNL
ncbi:MAG TPA: GRP family sugar transporter [Anaerolineales bacterium]|nr:GRP family sugar transporter [Anaerolineales bacterium]